MKKVNTQDAVGMVLCHDITAVKEGFKGRAFQRGHVITQEDVPALLDLGKKHIYIWEENAGEIHEEDAALRMAAMAQVEGGHYSQPSEGKVTLTADTDGLFRLNRPLLEQLNSIGDITISALPDHYPVKAGAKLASARIVPLVTQESQIIEAERLCRESETPLFRLLPYRKGVKAGIIVTGSEVFSGRIKDRFEPVIREKLGAFDAEILGCIFCDDDLAMLSGAVQQHLDHGADIVVMTGGMSVDPDDLTPTAIRATGAQVVTRGVPSQPGNMFMLAYLGHTAIMGVPGAAIHSKITVLDVVLPQIFTGEPLTRRDFVRMGAGGLCQGCGKDCRWPNCTFGKY